MSSDDIENKIQELGLTAPRVTPKSVAAVIKGAEYWMFGDTLTVCVLTLENGFTVLGESACASPENFNVDLGRELARKNAERKIWALEGYLLKQRLYEGSPIGSTLDVAAAPEEFDAVEYDNSFSHALVMMKMGRRATRRGWNGKNMWVAMQHPDTASKMRSVYLYMSPVDGFLVPWVASQTDILAIDWVVLP